MGSCAAPSAKGDDKFITTDYLQQCQNNHVRPKDRKLLLTTILADGINLGLTKMAESCPGTTKSSLEGALLQS